MWPRETTRVEGSRFSVSTKMQYLFTVQFRTRTVTVTGTEVAEIRMSSLVNVAWVHAQCQGLGPGMALVLGERRLLLQGVVTYNY